MPTTLDATSKSTSKFDSSLLEALPGLHALAGCDYTASFMNKGKQKPFDMMKMSEKLCEAYVRLGDGNAISQ